MTCLVALALSGLTCLIVGIIGLVSPEDIPGLSRAGAIALTVIGGVAVATSILGKRSVNHVSFSGGGRESATGTGCGTGCGNFETGTQFGNFGTVERMEIGFVPRGSSDVMTRA